MAGSAHDADDGEDCVMMNDDASIVVCLCLERGGGRLCQGRMISSVLSD